MTQKINKSNTLVELRQQIDACDLELLSLISRRLELVRQVLRQKFESGQNLFDRRRERFIYQKVQEQAALYGIEPQIARNLTRALLEASAEVQDAELKLHDHDSLEVKRFLIVGGAGRMGRRFQEQLIRRGHQVDILDYGETVTEQQVAAADLVMISVPMKVSSTVAKEIAPFVRPDALLFDINSLKLEICSTMAQSCKGEVLGTHPVFGPTIKSFWRQKIAVCPIKSGPLTEWLCAEFGRLGLDVVEATPEQHDRMMALVQVLTHFAKIVTAKTQAKSGIVLEEALRFTSPIYRLELSVIGRLFAQDPELYAEIEMANPYAKTIRDLFAESCQELNQILNTGSRDAFCQEFIKIREYLSNFSKDAMLLSDKVIDALVQEP